MIQRRYRSGFTFTEMLVVLFIMAVIVFLIAPNVLALQSDRTLLSTRSVLVSDLRLLQEKIRSEGERGEWRSNRGAYELVIVDSKRGEEVLLSRTLPKGVRIGHNGNILAPVVFRPNGQCNQYCTIQIYDESRRSYEIILYKTGRIREVAR